jgi:hypothetical protein
MTTALMFHVSIRPYDDDVLNIVEFFGLFSSLVVYFSAAFFKEVSLRTGEEVFTDVFSVTCVWAFIAFVLIGMLPLTRH